MCKNSQKHIENKGKIDFQISTIFIKLNNLNSVALKPKMANR